MEIKIPYCLQDVLLSLVSNWFTKWRELKKCGPMRDNITKD